MASRTRQKEEARQRRIAAEQVRVERSRRERRLRILGGTLLGAVAIVAVLIAVSTGGGGSKPAPKPNSAQGKTIASTVNSLLGGIPQAGNRIGSPTAPVTVTEFGDLECPICQTFALGAENSLIAHEVRTGKVKLVYRSLCTATCNGAGQTTFTTQQTAAVAAGKQNLEWYYILLFYHLQGQENTGYVTPTYLNGLARLVPGLNYSTWQSDSGSSSLASQVTQDQQFAASNGWTSTPTLYATGPKGQTQAVQASLTYSELQKAIQTVS
ncbi:MAG: DsbA family protein [Actinomycetota bacterium]|nr:DsbA family protein [Actinomycetota bacterium]